MRLFDINNGEMLDFFPTKQSIKVRNGHTMLTLTRQVKIISLLKQHGTITVTQLCDTLYASPSTIRRDLSELEAKGFIKRVHGGAVLIKGGGTEEPFKLRSEKNLQQKNRIADLASRFLSNSKTFFFDGGTTCGALVSRLYGYTDVKVLTNGLEILNNSQNSNRMLLSTGGILYSPIHKRLLGSIAISTIESMHADAFFFSVAGVSQFGVTEESDEVVQVKRAFSRHSNLTIVLADSTKIGKTATYKVMDLNDVDYLVTEKEPEDPYYRQVLGSRLICK